MLARCWYFLEKATSSVRHSPGISFLTTGTIAAALLIAGLYIMGLQNLEKLAMVWGRSAAVSAYIDDNLDTSVHALLANELARIPGVAHAVVISPEEALERFRRQGSHAAELVRGVEPGILPASIEVSITSGFADLHATKNIAAAALKVPGIIEVDYGEEEFAKLQLLLELLRVFGLAMGALIAVATAFIVSNTIRLTVYSRRDEISILRLVGATHWFIRTPFLFEGALWGLCGALLAIGLLAVMNVALAPHLSHILDDIVGGIGFDFFANDMALVLFLLGLLLGVFGSGLAVRRFLDEEVA